MTRAIIELLRPECIEEIRPLIGAYKHKPLQYYDVPEQGLNEYVMYTLHECFQDPAFRFAYVGRQGDQVKALAVLKALPWDKEIFGVEMASLLYLISPAPYEQSFAVETEMLKLMLESSAKIGIKHVSARVPEGDTAAVHALEENGFKHMDTLLTYAIDLRKASLPEVRSAFPLRAHRESDIDAIAELAEMSFTGYFGRFHTDPGLDKDKATRLYVEWARNSCHGYADHVIVAEDGAEVVAFATYKTHKDASRFINHDIGEMVLVGVSPKTRGRGVYQSFTHYGMRWFRENKVDFEEIVTQTSNTFVQRAWSNAGLRMANCRLTFHKWL